VRYELGFYIPENDILHIKLQFSEIVLLFPEMEMGYYQGNEDSPSEGAEFISKRAVSHQHTHSPYPRQVALVLPIV
jgi:hypothetical protein